MTRERLPVLVDYDPTVRFFGGSWVYEHLFYGHALGIQVVVEPDLPRRRRHRLLRLAARRVARLQGEVTSARTRPVPPPHRGRRSTVPARRMPPVVVVVDELAARSGGMIVGRLPGRIIVALAPGLSAERRDELLAVAARLIVERYMSPLEVWS